MIFTSSRLDKYGPFDIAFMETVNTIRCGTYLICFRRKVLRVESIYRPAVHPIHWGTFKITHSDDHKGMPKLRSCPSLSIP